MATSADRARTALHEALDEAVGQHNADTLMGYLPPVGWADVATKADLETLRIELGALGTDLRAEIAAVRFELRSEIARTEASLERALRAQTVWIVGALFAAVALAVSLSQLLG